jgi:hypothetical protein
VSLPLPQLPSPLSLSPFLALIATPDKPFFRALQIQNRIASPQSNVCSPSRRWSHIPKLVSHRPSLVCVLQRAGLRPPLPRRHALRRRERLEPRRASGPSTNNLPPSQLAFACMQRSFFVAFDGVAHNAAFLCRHRSFRSRCLARVLRGSNRRIRPRRPLFRRRCCRACSNSKYVIHIQLPSKSNFSTLIARSCSSLPAQPPRTLHHRRSGRNGPCRAAPYAVCAGWHSPLVCNSF